MCRRPLDGRNGSEGVEEFGVVDMGEVVPSDGGLDIEDSGAGRIRRSVVSEVSRDITTSRGMG